MTEEPEDSNFAAVEQDALLVHPPPVVPEEAGAPAEDEEEGDRLPGGVRSDASLIERMQLFSTVASHVLSLIAIVVVFYWIEQLGGLSWKAGQAKLVFNWHPVMMIAAFFFMTTASLQFRFPHGPLHNRTLVKLLHGSAWLVAALCGLVGLVAVLKSHNDPVSGLIANMYSLHSWIGATVVLAYIAQFLVGFFSFGCSPRCFALAPSTKASIKTVHLFVGRTVYLATAVTILLGIQEKEGFVGCSYKVEDRADGIVPNLGQIPAACRTSHALGLLVLVTALTTSLALCDFGPSAGSTNVVREGSQQD
jgi:hypothetical protein